MINIKYSSKDIKITDHNFENDLDENILDDYKSITYGEKALWRAVVTQSLVDCVSNPRRTSDKIEKARAISWLLGGSKDFYAVCHMADMDPSYVMEKADRLIKQHRKTNNKKA